MVDLELKIGNQVSRRLITAVWTAVAEAIAVASTLTLTVNSLSDSLLNTWHKIANTSASGTIGSYVPAMSKSCDIAVRVSHPLRALNRGVGWR